MAWEIQPVPPLPRGGRLVRSVVAAVIVLVPVLGVVIWAVAFRSDGVPNQGILDICNGASQRAELVDASGNVAGVGCEAPRVSVASSTN